MNELLRFVPPSRRSLVKEKGAWLAGDVARWASSVDSQLGPPLYNNLGFAVAATAPTVSQPKLSTLVRLAAWTYLLDDRLDSTSVSMEECRRTGASVRDVLSGRRPAAARDFLESSIEGILDDLLPYDRARVIARLTTALVDGVDASAEHAVLSRRVVSAEMPLPSAEAYLEVASRHINYRALALTLVLLVGEPLPPGALDSIDQALVPGSRAMRLANDLRTAAKDAAEGSLNVLGLTSARDGRPVTGEDVVRQIADALQSHTEQLRSLATFGLASTSRTLARCLRVGLAAYRTADLKQRLVRPRPALT